MIIAVTGSTGHIGGQVARALAGRGVGARLVVRNADRAPALPGAEIVQASYGDADAVRQALTGVDVVFMVSAGESRDRVDQHRTFVTAAADAGVKHVVYTSFAAASADASFTLGRDHFHTEEAIRASGMDWTFLRDNFYADVVPLFADPAGVIRGPAGEGRCAFVARSDVAASAVEVLADPAAHAGETYTLTGPRALTLDEAAAILTSATGRPFSFVNETLDEAYASRRLAWPGEPDWQYDAWVSTYTAIASGVLSVVTSDVERLLGRPATGFEECLRSLDLN